MNRRTFLASALATASATAGCLGLGGSPSGDGGDADGYPSDSQIDSRPEERDVDESSFGSLETNGEQITLIPVAVAHYWWGRKEARFADARGEKQYTTSHITGAALSPAGADWDGDPVKQWPKDDRIVCYCGCPHHLSSIRASSLQQNGYSKVYVIDEGYWEWHRQGFPVAGKDPDWAPYESWEISGEVDPRHAGDYAWAFHEPSSQQEAAPIQDSGAFTLDVKFSGVDDSTPITLQTPAWTISAPLGTLTGGVVRNEK